MSTDIEKVLTAYLECALWSSLDCDDDSLDDYFSVSDFSPESVLLARKDVEDFLTLATPYIGENVKDTQVGHDYWLTRNRHGDGFWGRPEIYGENNAEKLTEIAESFGEKYLYAGDDNKLYFG